MAEEHLSDLTRGDHPFERSDSMEVKNEKGYK